MNTGTVAIAARAAGVLVGVSLMVAPAIVEVETSTSHVARIAGPIVASLCIIATSGVLTPLRWLTVITGGILVLAAVWIRQVPDSALLAVAGIVIALLGLVPSPPRESHGAGWRGVSRDWRAGS